MLVKEAAETLDKREDSSEQEANTKSDQIAVSNGISSTDAGVSVDSVEPPREEITRRMWIRHGDLRVEFARDRRTDGA